MKRNEQTLCLFRGVVAFLHIVIDSIVSHSAGRGGRCQVGTSISKIEPIPIRLTEKLPCIGSVTIEKIHPENCTYLVTPH
jgi:hypothetical protein